MRMELGLSQQQTIKQIQTLSPQMYMSMEILCLNSLDLEERIETELQNNETLELQEQQTPRESPDGAETGAGEDRERPLTSDASFEQRMEQWDRFSHEEYGGSRGGARFSGERDEKLDALSNTEGRPITLQEHLEEQVHLLDDAQILAVIGREVSVTIGPDLAEEIHEIRSLCTDIVYNIDNRGYLMYDLEEIRVSLEDPPALSRLEDALKVVQSLDPPGLGGRGLEECLLLQLSRDRQSYPMEEAIIREHLKDLGHNRYPKIAKALGISIDDVKTAAENIASLDPLPGRIYGGETPPFIKPDVVVDEVEGEYEVRVESGYLPRLQVSPHYRSLYREARSNPDLKKYLKRKLDGADWLISAIRQRQSTLERIAREVVGVQRGFLDHGISHLKPLKMVEIAERVGVHVSTISRAISGKYVQTPRGIYPLKFFFTRGATKSDGSTEARGSVIERIKTLVEAEDKQNPLSDIDIAKKLAEASIKISRRTVTKYREAEGIASSRERRAY